MTRLKLAKISSLIVLSIGLINCLHGESSWVDHLSANIDTSVKYDSNVYSNNGEASDVLKSVNPHIDWKKEDGIIHTKASFGIDVGRFDSFSDEDFEDYKADISFSYPHGDESSRLSLDGGTSYKETTSANETIGTRSETAKYNTYLNGEYDLSDRFGISMSPDYTYSDAKTTGQRSSSVYSLTTKGLYKYSEKMEAFVSHRYRDTDVKTALGGGTDSTDTKEHAFFVGVDGDLLSKLNGSFEVGYQFLDSSNKQNIGDTENIYLKSSLKWKFSDITSFTISGEQDNSMTAGGQLNKKQNLTFKISHDYNEKISISPKISFTNAKYTGNNSPRKDDNYNVGSDLDYTLIKDKLTLKFSIDYTDQRSTGTSTFIYDHFVTSLSIPYRF